MKPMHLKSPPAGQCINTLATRISNSREPMGTFYLVFLILMICSKDDSHVWEMCRTGRKLPDEQQTKDV